MDDLATLLTCTVYDLMTTDFGRNHVYKNLLIRVQVQVSSLCVWGDFSRKELQALLTLDGRQEGQGTNKVERDAGRHLAFHDDREQSLIPERGAETQLLRRSSAVSKHSSHCVTGK